MTTIVSLLLAWIVLNLAATAAVLWSYSRRAARLGLMIGDTGATPRTRAYQALGCVTMMLGLFFSALALLNPFLLLLSLPLLPIGLGVSLYLGEPDPSPPDGVDGAVEPDLES